MAFQGYNISKTFKGWFLKLPLPWQIQDKYLLHVRPLTFFGIISAVEFLQQQTRRSQQKSKSLFNTFLKNQKPLRIVYKKLISDKGEQPLSCQERLQKDIESTANKKMNWRKAYQLTVVCTRSSKLIDFNFKVFT